MKMVEILDNRELKEIMFAEEYLENYNHGTSGHIRLVIIAKLAKHIRELEHTIEMNNK